MQQSPPEKEDGTSTFAWPTAEAGLVLGKGWRVQLGAGYYQVFGNHDRVGGPTIGIRFEQKLNNTIEYPED